jgi:hypothetical protein
MMMMIIIIIITITVIVIIIIIIIIRVTKYVKDCKLLQSNIYFRYRKGELNIT